MLRLSHTLLKKKREIPMGFSKHDFFQKLRSPRASKPWRDRAARVGGSIDVSTSLEHREGAGNLLSSLTRDGHKDSSGGSSSSSLSYRPPLGIRSPYVTPAAASLQAGTAAAAAAAAGAPALPSSAGTTAPDAARDALLAPPGGAGGGAAASSLQVPPMATLPFGTGLDWQVEAVHTHSDGLAAGGGGGGEAGVPVHLQHLTRTKKEAADSILLPRHINKLFHKIMGWTEDLVEMDAERAAEAEHATGRQGEPQLLRKKMSNLTEKMKYGVLLDAYENDKFALEHRIELAGNKLERKFLEWEGVHVLDQDASADLAHVLEHKAAIVMESPASAKIPVVNRDCCPGCGALLQDQSEDNFGYVAPGEIERYVKQRDEKAKARAEYAGRMAELQAHWEKHGRQVGEEWLDFMTQDEFNAFYRDRREPFVCHRCHALENLGVTGRRKVWAAPDFTEQLTALREKRCVVVLVVDITDFPGSMVYDLPGLISMNNDVIIAVNKMDCVRNRSFQYKGQDRAVAARLVSERYVRQWVLDIAVQFGLPRRQVRAVVPVSAKRGWNMDRLIAAVEDAANLHLRRPHKPLPTYFTGVANVGKSSVINAMAHYLYVPQPPHPKSTKVYYSKMDPKTKKEVVLWRWYTPPDVNRAEMFDIPAHHDKKASKLLTTSSLPGTTVAVNAVKLFLTHSHKKGDANAEEDVYLYDTPGLLPHWHRESPLTLLQMRRTLIRKYRNPQCFILIPGHTLFLGGLAAVDIVKGPAKGILFLVYTSQKVRNGIVRTEGADQFWAEQLGKQLDPPGSYEQLLEGSADGTTPSLSVVRSYIFECYNKHRRRPKADLYVCGLGWASFCVSEASDVVLRVRTLPGVVHGVREPLRYNDLRAYRAWPRLRRGATSRALEDAALGLDAESVNTVVQLTSDAHASTTPPQKEEEEASPPHAEGAARGPEDGGSFTVVSKTRHPHHAAAADAPLGALLEEMQHAGKL